MRFIYASDIHGDMDKYNILIELCKNNKINTIVLGGDLLTKTWEDREPLQREFIHNGLKEYYSSLIKDCNEINNVGTLNPNVINDPAIYSILASKYYLAEEHGINLSLDVFFDLRRIDNKRYKSFFDLIIEIVCFADRRVFFSHIIREYSMVARNNYCCF